LRQKSEVVERVVVVDSEMCCDDVECRCEDGFSGGRCELTVAQSTSGRPDSEEQSSSSVGIHVYVAAVVAALLVVTAAVVAVCCAITRRRRRYYHVPHTCTLRLMTTDV